VKRNTLIALGMFTLCLICFTIVYVKTASINNTKMTVQKSDTKDDKLSKTPRASQTSNIEKTESTDTIAPDTPTLKANSSTPVKTSEVPSVAIQPTSTFKDIQNTNTPNPLLTDDYSKEIDFVSTGTVKSAVNTNAEPKNNSQTISVLQPSQTVNIIAKYGGWYRLSDGSYVYKSFITLAQ
jgi:hypothetical protein